MATIKEAIKDFIEERTYQPSNEFTYNFRVEESNGGYEAIIINSFAEIIYAFSDVRDEVYDDGEDGYSAIVDFVSCKITPFEADADTQYYVDKLNKYIERCEIVSNILDKIDVYSDPEERTYF
jgi:hypothetical protein